MGALAVGSRPQQQQRPALLIGGLILIILIGLRFRVGCDWDTYQDLFDYSQYASFSTATDLSDPAFGALNWVVASLGLGVWAVNLVCAVIFTWGLVNFCRWQPNPPLAMLVAVPYLVIVVAMGYTRQSAALGFIMFALTYYQRGSALGVLVSLVCAILFHKASILIFPFFGLGFARNFLFSVIIFGILSYAAYTLFVYKSVNFLIYGYIQQEYSSSGATIRVLMNVVPAVLLLGYRNRFGLNRNNRRLWILLSMASLGAVVLLYLSPSSTAVDRAALFLIPLQVFVLSRVPSAFSPQGRQSMLLVAAIVAYSLAVEIVWLDFGQFSKCWIPYRSYLWS
jgi:hypothetical protein